MHLILQLKVMYNIEKSGTTKKHISNSLFCCWKNKMEFYTTHFLIHIYMFAEERAKCKCKVM